MRRIILTLAVSLDGFIEGPNQEIDWIEFTEDSGKALTKFLKEIDSIFYGRASYEAWGNYTPGNDSTEFEKEFYRELNKKTKYVFSSTRKSFDGNPIVINSDIEYVTKQLKHESGKNIWLYGGAGLISTFVNLDLVDEFRLAVFPIILGDGNPLFRDIKHRVKLRLLEVKSGESGVVELNYQRLNN